MSEMSMTVNRRSIALSFQYYYETTASINLLNYKPQILNANNISWLSQLYRAKSEVALQTIDLFPASYQQMDLQ